MFRASSFTFSIMGFVCQYQGHNYYYSNVKVMHLDYIHSFSLAFFFESPIVTVVVDFQILSGPGTRFVTKEVKSDNDLAVIAIVASEKNLKQNFEKKVLHCCFSN
jgi:hypothetical protein